MEDIVTQRVNEFRQKNGLSILAFSKKINMGQATLNKQLKDGGCGVSISTIVNMLSTFPNLSSEWLLRGNGTMENRNNPIQDDSYVRHLEREVEYLREQNMLLLGGGVREKVAG